MYNSFSFVFLFIKKSITRRGLKIIGNFLIFIICLNIVIKWHTVPTMNDEISFWCFDSKNEYPSLLEIDIKNPYYAFSTKDLAEASVNLNLNKIYTRSSPHYYKPLNDFWTSCLDRTKYKDRLKDLNDIHYLYIVDIQKTIDILPLRGSLLSESEKILKDTLYEYDFGGHVVHDKFVYKEGKTHLHELLVKYGKENTTIDPLKSTIISQKRAWRSYFDLHDISQLYYNIAFHKLPLSKDSITLSLDFGGATRFSGVYPSPDEVNVSSH